MEDTIVDVLGLQGDIADEPPTRRFKRFRRYRRRGTASSVIKLTQDATWNLNDGQTNPRWNAFSFSPVSLPGFTDYQATYSHFRILKAKALRLPHDWRQ